MAIESKDAVKINLLWMFALVCLIAAIAISSILNHRANIRRAIELDRNARNYTIEMGKLGYVWFKAEDGTYWKKVTTETTKVEEETKGSPDKGPPHLRKN